MLDNPIFRNRIEAGRALAARLRSVVDDPHPLVLALPRGGVPVGYEVAQELHGDLDIFLVRKLGVPGQEELAMGAIASGGGRVLNDAVIDALGITTGAIARATAREQQEIERREQLYREDRPPQAVTGRTAILVDDGLATGASMLAAVRAVRTQQPKRIIVAVPVASRDTSKAFRRHVDEIVCLATPDPFHAVGSWYEDFTQTTDQEVRELLKRAAHERVA